MQDRSARTGGVDGLMSKTPPELTLAAVAETLEPSFVRRALWIVVGAMIVAVAALGLTWGVSIWSVGFAVLALAQRGQAPVPGAAWRAAA